MNPQITHSSENASAQWVNDAPTLEVSAQRFSMIIHGGKPTDTAAAAFVPRPRF